MRIQKLNQLVGLAASLLASSASAAPHTSASIKKASGVVPIAKADFQAAKANLTFINDDGKPVALTQYVLPVSFTDIDGTTKEVTKILLDPTYINPGHQPDADDFQMEIKRVRPTGSKEAYSGFSLCKWGKGKSKARCAIEDGDSSFELAVISRGPTLKTSSFRMTVTKPGFALATYEDTGSVHGLVVSPKGTAPVTVSLSFK